MPQDAVALIKADHRKVEQLFREFEEAGDRAHKTKQQLVEQIIKELEVHATIEEEEEEMLPQSEEVLGKEELTRLGEVMAARKQQLGAD